MTSAEKIFESETPFAWSLTYHRLLHRPYPIAIILLYFPALILVPTRELALQTSAIVIEMAKHMKVGAMVTTGGTVLKDDIMRLQAAIHILVGTPGRVHDLADRGIANLSKCKIIVMDEADKLLSPEFQPSKCTCRTLPPALLLSPPSIVSSSVPSLHHSLTHLSLPPSLPLLHTFLVPPLHHLDASPNNRFLSAARQSLT